VTAAFRSALVALLVVLAAGCTQFGGIWPGGTTGSTPAAVPPAAGSEATGQARLYAAVLAYVGRYREKFGFAIDSSMPLATTPGQRYGLQATKVTYVSAAIAWATATGTDPVVALRDLLVGIQLQRLVWDDPRREREFPPEAVARMRRALASLEATLNQLAATVVTRDTLAYLRDLVGKWRAANPDQDYVAFVTLDMADIAALDARFRTDARRRGFFAPVSEAARQLEVTNQVAERALFLVNQLPILAEWNAELLVLRTFDTPEALGVLEFMSRFVGAVETLNVEVIALPDRIANERNRTLQQFGDVFRTERQATLDQVAAEAERLQPLLRDLAAASAALAQTAASLERLFPPGEPGEPKGDTLGELDGVLRQVSRASTDVRALLDEARPLVAGEVPAAGLTAALDALLHRVFLYTAALLVLAAALAAGVVWLARRPSRA
jgi:hypothetical protein